MGLTYFKRYRMEIDLAGRDFSVRSRPGYDLIPWSPELLEVHAEVKYLSFRAEIDANVFPCFADRSGCLRLMDEIRRKEGFLPGATWLVRYVDSGLETPTYCGTIQGVDDQIGFGAIQNLGITPPHRGRGLAAILMKHALAGFQRHGLRRAYLEVTAQNRLAVDLYHRLGFAKARTLYKAVEVAYT